MGAGIMRYLFWDTNGNPVEIDGVQVGTNYGPKSVYLIAQELSKRLGFKVLWSDEKEGKQ